MQGDLEQSLERLNGKNEEKWVKYLDLDHNDLPILGKKFFKYK